MRFNRYIFESLYAHLDKQQVTVLTGMRRTGKTTLVKQLMDASPIKQKLFFDLERIDNRKIFEHDNYELSIQYLEQQGVNFSERVMICLDEIQLSPNIPSVIKYLNDHYNIKFVVTGSSSYYLKNKFQESMAGRKKIFEIFPLTFGEYLHFNGVNYKSFAEPNQFINLPLEYDRLKMYYENYIQYGGFPQVALSKSNAEKTDILNDIISSYINIDIMQLADVRKISDVYNLVRLLAARIGNKIEISKLAISSNIARQTVDNYIDLLENSYLIKTLPVYSQNPDKEIVKAKKLYFYDNGLANICAELGGGAKFENAVFTQLHHYGDLAYYQLKTGQEIDFILNKKYAYEVKETAYETDSRKMMNLAKKIQINQGKVIGRYANQEFESFIWGGMIK
jgi:predicted AAA+ superfamily ATPase